VACSDRFTISARICAGVLVDTSTPVSALMFALIFESDILISLLVSGRGLVPLT